MLLEETAEAPSSAQPARNENVKLHYIDGLRAICALYVVIGHIPGDYLDHASQAVSPRILQIFALTRYSHLAVCIFIAVSGYCLMLPVARSKNGELRGGFSGYLFRRARRILPPYYATLFLTLGLIWAIPALQVSDPASSWSGYLPAFTPGAIVTHLLLIHNWWHEWIMKINGPCWSIAVEWQIYFFFPLLLLPVWRKFGVAAAIAAGFTVGVLPHYLLPASSNLDWTYPWFIGLFAAGMGAASLNFRSDDSLQRRLDRMWLGTFALIAYALFIANIRGLVHIPQWIADGTAGLGTACLLIKCTHALQHGRNPAILKVLAWKPLVALGVFSYSIYLVHRPLISVGRLLLQELEITGNTFVLVNLFVLVPAIIGICYLFYLAFERPFMSSPSKKKPS
jgi:peptidoglycan/LPS O-acetylase OafA/YrhL